MSEIHARGRPGPGENAPGDSIPPGAAKPTTPQDFPQAKCKSRLHPGTFARRSAKADNALDFAAAKCESRPACPEFRTAKRESRPGRRTFLRRSAKADPGGRLCPGPGFLAARPAPAAAKTVRFLIPRGKASFYETATFRRRKVLFSSPFCGLLFCPGRAKLTVPAGKSPPPEPRPPPRRPTPNDRDRLPVFAPPARTPAPATPPQSACSRRRSGRPQRPNLFGRRLPESPKGKGKGKEEARMERTPPV